MFARTVTAFVAAAALGLLAPAHAMAGQIVSAEPLYDSADLTSGFTPDPYVVDLASGGTNGTDDLPDDCVGFISGLQPDFTLQYDRDSGGFSLTFFVHGPSDTTLIVNGPDGDWHCNDDAGGPDGLQPTVVFDSPDSGKSDVWVGELISESYNDVRLMITEVDPDWSSLAVTLADDDLGGDSGPFANDGECDDPRFGGLLDCHLGRDATDCSEASGDEQRLTEGAHGFPL